MDKKIEAVLMGAVYPIFIYLEFDIVMTTSLCYLMLLDSILGGVAAFRIGEEFKISVFLWGFLLKIILLSIPVTFALMGKGLGYDFKVMVDISIKMMVVSEGYSIFGKIYSIITRKKIKDIDIISIFLISVRKILYRMIKKAIYEIEKSGNCHIK